MIRVTIVPRLHGGRMGGVTRYLLGIISSVAPGARDIDLRILHRGREIPAQEWLEGGSWLRQRWKGARKLDEAILWPLALSRSSSAVVHFPSGRLPQGWRAGTAPRIVTLHGTARLTGSWHSTQSRKDGELTAKQLRRGLSKLARVVAVSQWAKQDVVETFDLPPEQVEVIPNGVDLATFRSLPQRDGAEALVWLRETLGIETPYLLYVGPCAPRKNTLRLVQAFGHLRQRCHTPHRLVVAGAPDLSFPEVVSEVTRLGLTDDIVFAGPVSDETLVRLYNGASVFVFPSLYEGFGIPVLEAMACGTPVVTSNCTALPETAGGAAALVDDPTSVENLAAVIQHVLEDAAYREALRQRGLVRAQAFSWEACATAHLKLYRRVTEERGRTH